MDIGEKPKTFPFVEIIWIIISAVFLYLPTKLIGGDFASRVAYKHSFTLGGDSVGPLLVASISFLFVLILGIFLSLVLKKRLILISFGVLLLMTLIFFIYYRNVYINDINSKKEELISKEVSISSANVKTGQNNLEFNDGTISFNLPNRFVLISEENQRDIQRIVFSDHSDHITVTVYGGFDETVSCQNFGYPPCNKNANGAEISSKINTGYSQVYRAFSKNSIKKFYEFSIQSATTYLKDPNTANLDTFDNQLRNSINF